MNAARVTVTGATGLLGSRLVASLQRRGAHVTVLTRDPQAARERLGAVEAVAWEPLAGSAPAAALDGRDAVVHLAGEPLAQRWSARARRAIRDSRVLGTRNLLAGASQAQRPPRALISASGVGYYGAHGEEPLDEDAPPGADFLARVCVEWEAECERASALGMRTVQLRIGVVLDRAGGALARMLPPFRLGLGGPLAGGRQYVSWIHSDDVVGMLLAAVVDERWRGPVNATAPEPVTNRAFTRALGAALHLLYGRMASVVTSGARVMPARALVLGFEFDQPQLAGALHTELGRRLEHTGAERPANAPLSSPPPQAPPGAAPPGSRSR